MNTKAYIAFLKLIFWIHGSSWKIQRKEWLKTSERHIHRQHMMKEMLRLAGRVPNDPICQLFNGDLYRKRNDIHQRKNGRNKTQLKFTGTVWWHNIAALLQLAVNGSGIRRRQNQPKTRDDVHDWEIWLTFQLCKYHGVSCRNMSKGRNPIQTIYSVQSTVKIGYFYSFWGISTKACEWLILKQGRGCQLTNQVDINHVLSDIQSHLKVQVVWLQS